MEHIKEVSVSKFNTGSIRSNIYDITFTLFDNAKIEARGYEPLCNSGAILFNAAFYFTKNNECFKIKSEELHKCSPAGFVEAMEECIKHYGL